MALPARAASFKHIETMQVISKQPTARVANEVDGRLAIRQRFKLAAEFLGPVRKLIHRGFATKQKGKTAFGRAMTHVMLRAVEGDYPDQTVNPARARLSKGVLYNPLQISIMRTGQTVQVDYSTGGPNGFNQAWDDRVLVCAYHPELRVAGINDEQALREDGSLTLQLPSLLQNKLVHFYLMVHSRDGKRWSNSKYLGEF